VADPKIRYDIAATASGAADVERLANEFEKLDTAVDPQLAERARTAGQALRDLGQQQAAVDTFVAIKRESLAAKENLAIAQRAAQEFAAELGQSGTATRAQAGQLEKLRDAVSAAKTEVVSTTRSLEAARAGLDELGIEAGTTASKSVQLRKELAAVSAEVEQLAATSKGAGGFGRLVTDTDAARAKMEAAAKAVADFERTIGQAGPPTSAQASQLRTLQGAAALATTELEQMQSAMTAEIASLRQAGVNTEQLAQRSRELAAAQQAGANASKANAAAFTQQGQAAQASAAQQLRANESVRGSLQGIGDQLRTLQNVAAAVVGGQLLAGSLGDLARVADGYTNLQARIGLVTGEGQALQQAFDGVFQVAQRTNSSLETTGNLFTRIAAAGKDIGVTTQQALALTETINQAVQVSGASAQASDAALTQLIQGLQSGVLRGEEFNSVMEQAPRLAKALADGLGISTGALREQAQAGVLTSQTVIAALQGQADVVAREFSKLPPTVGRAITNLSTSWTQYVGEVDAANGISSAAASIITGLANNLDTLASVLIGAGKAAAAYKAIQLAQTFIANAQASATATVAAEREAIAKAQSTAANVANTAATTANTAAKVANAAAGSQAAAAADSAAAAAGRFGAIIGTLKNFALLGIVTNLGDIGRALGEGIAKLQGYGKASAEAEAMMRADENAARDNARQMAALAQAKQLATAKALELSKAAQTLVGDFEGMRTKGESTADALGKITKNLSLGDLQGIKDAGAALDALALKGQITGDQVRESLAAALKGADLAAFKANATAAFDGSEQGARRLADSMGGVVIESLRRAGTSVEELRTGFSVASAGAINDVDTLAQTLEELGTKGTDAGRALSGSLDKALDASNTERAVQAVIARWQELGAQGLVTGDQLAAGLEKARGKLDTLKPGINTLDEALRTFGLKSASELQRTADNFKSAWEQIRNSTTTSLADKQRAFEQYAAAATAANKGVVPSEIEVQREMLKIQQSANDTGKAMKDLGDTGTRSMDGMASAASRAGNAVAEAAAKARDAKFSSPLGTSDQKYSAPEGKSVTGNNREERLAGQNAIDAGGFFALKEKLAAGTLTPADAALVEALAAQVRQNAQINQNVPAGALSFDALQSFSEMAAVSQRASEVLRAQQARDAAQKNIDRPQPSVGGASYKVELVLNGKSSTIKTADAQSAQMLSDFMRGLQEAAARAI
jgi:tape measure domain-containing protein